MAEIDLSGAGFQAAIVLGGILIGGYVDRTKRFKGVTQACLAATLFLLLVPLSPASGVPPAIVLPSLLALGALVGPVQPINAELAVEVSYPADENTIEAMQQLCGNLFSALLVPVAERAATSTSRSRRSEGPPSRCKATRCCSARSPSPRCSTCPPSTRRSNAPPSTAPPRTTSAAARSSPATSRAPTTRSPSASSTR